MGDKNSLSLKQRQLRERRLKVYQHWLKGWAQTDIVRILKVTRRTVYNDLEAVSSMTKLPDFKARLRELNEAHERHLTDMIKAKVFRKVN